MSSDLKEVREPRVFQAAEVVSAKALRSFCMKSAPVPTELPLSFLFPPFPLFPFLLSLPPSQQHVRLHGDWELGVEVGD